MPKFNVFAQERVFYQMTVEAENEEAAIEAGRKAWLEGQYTVTGQDDFQMDDAEQIDEEAA